MQESSDNLTSISIGPSCTAYILLKIDCECQQKLNATLYLIVFTTTIHTLYNIPKIILILYSTFEHNE